MTIIDKMECVTEEGLASLRVFLRQYKILVCRNSRGAIYWYPGVDALDDMDGKLAKALPHGGRFAVHNGHEALLCSCKTIEDAVFTLNDLPRIETRRRL